MTAKKLTLLESVYDYVVKYSQLPATCVFQGGVNHAHLPKNSNNFAVINLLNTYPVGTNQDTYMVNTIQVTSIIRASVQVDVYGDTLDLARKNIQQLHTLFRGVVACDFFKEHGYSPLYADDVRIVHTVDASKQYVSRVSTTLHFCYSETFEQPYNSFYEVQEHIKNVDIYTGV